MAPDDAWDEGDVEQPSDGERQLEQASDTDGRQKQADDEEQQLLDDASRAAKMEPVDSRNPRKNQIG